VTSIKPLIAFLVTIALPHTSAISNDHNDANCLIASYPEILSAVNNHGNVIAKDGTEFTFNEGIDRSSFTQLLENSDLKAQLSQQYTLERLTEPPTINFDPGRLRSSKFFEHLYGKSEKDVRENLVKVFWKPCNCHIVFNKAAGAASALGRVGSEIGSQSGIQKYVSKPNGSFKWRKIKGTTRLSMHAFAIAIDFDLPNNMSTYWQWTHCNDGNSCKYPRHILKDEGLAKIVEIFESHGFIWGGKWHHFDTMHFEYRPELLNRTCRRN
jgi:peptidoglycan L-alanyl-D-glutamate endopeptidase CwlK